jgi:hypothetical protein
MPSSRTQTNVGPAGVNLVKQRRRRRRRSAEPLAVVCIRCGATMVADKIEPKVTYGVNFRRQTYHCVKCDHTQTYTLAGLKQ